MNYFICYGDKHFASHRREMLANCKKFGLFDKHYGFDRDALEARGEFKKANVGEFNEVFKARKGGGFWIWKPFIIYETLRNIEDGEILVYADAGLGFVKTAKKKLEVLFADVEKDPLGILTFYNPFIEKNWTDPKVFKHFKVEGREDILDTRQVAAGRLHVARKTKESLAIYKEWWDIAREHPDLFSDSKNSFKNHRHDQSVWSVLCKIRGVSISNKWNKLPTERKWKL